MASSNRKSSPAARAADARWQAQRRTRLAQAGQVPVTVIMRASVAEILRSLAREHGKPQGDVLELGVLVARRELEARAAAGAQAGEAEQEPG